MTDDELRGEFAAIQQQFRNAAAYMQQFRSEVVERLDSIERSLSILSTTVAGVDARMPAVTRDVLAQEERHRSTAARLADIEARLRRLEGAA